jgi:hypothetical protein
MAGMAILCSDKTGTLTQNKMVIQEETPLYEANETQDSVLRYAAMAAKWKEPPRDALDTLTLTAADLKSLDHVEQLDFMPFDPTVKRTEGHIRDKLSGETFRCTKGAPHVLLKVDIVGQHPVGGVPAHHYVVNPVQQQPPHAFHVLARRTAVHAKGRRSRVDAHPHRPG